MPERNRSLVLFDQTLFELEPDPHLMDSRSNLYIRKLEFIPLKGYLKQDKVEQTAYVYVHHSSDLIQ
jgi:hypothetical protein